MANTETVQEIVVRSEKMKNDPTIGMLVLTALGWYAHRDSYSEYGWLVSLQLKILPFVVFSSQWAILASLFSWLNDGENPPFCGKDSRAEGKVLMSIISAVYLSRSIMSVTSFFIVFKETNLIRDRSWLSPLAYLDWGMESSFSSLLLLFNLWMVYSAHKPLDMVINILAMEFVGKLDNEMKEFFFTRFRDYMVNIINDNAELEDINWYLFGCSIFRCGQTIAIPLSLFLVSVAILTPFFCLAFVVFGPICKSA
mmetsp:Transcript_21509/g.45187  ORF Transcript_21509/g.45187 Transcript_21509/m.45187 type:complete len:254 (-) Transcript_21509:461-1222(-)